jgi:NADPH-dependent 2,4-dienoyl-CoA reductase/sulfur reductase-like enzyme
MAIGVRPDTGLAKAAGLTIGTRGGIEVDDFNRTSNHDIYAVGDAAEKTDAIDGSATLVPLANLANRHGRVVADHIAGRATRPIKTIGTAKKQIGQDQFLERADLFQDHINYRTRKGQIQNMDPKMLAKDKAQINRAKEIRKERASKAAVVKKYATGGTSKTSKK